VGQRNVLKAVFEATIYH